MTTGSRLGLAAALAIASAAMLGCSATTAPLQAGSNAPPVAQGLFEKGRQAEKQDPAAAAKLYREAALAGSGAAAKHLGQLYLKGAKGVHRDRVEANKWLQMAQSLGEEIPQPPRVRVDGFGEVRLTR